MSDRTTKKPENLDLKAFRFLYVTRFELATFWSVARRSIQLSYTYISVTSLLPQQHD